MSSRLGFSFAAAAVMLTLSVGWGHAADPEVIDIGSRRELFVDKYVIENMDGAELRLHRPTPRDVVIVQDQPWEGSSSHYMTVFKDGVGYDATKLRESVKGTVGLR